MTDDKRLIEEYLPIEALNAEASQERSVRNRHISNLHLWSARRPLGSCRTTVFILNNFRWMPIFVVASRDPRKGLS